MKLSQTRIAIALAILVVTTSSGCGMVNRIRAKNELNEAARAYREGRFPEAEQHSRRALEVDPDNKTALSFIARTIHAQYKPGVQTPENIAKANEAIQAYQRILAKDPKNDEAYKAIAYLYGALKEDDKLKAWITARANDASVEPEKRAESVVIEIVIVERTSAIHQRRICRQQLNRRDLNVIAFTNRFARVAIALGRGMGALANPRVVAGLARPQRSSSLFDSRRLAESKLPRGFD